MFRVSAEGKSPELSQEQVPNNSPQTMLIEAEQDFLQVALINNFLD